MILVQLSRVTPQKKQLPSDKQGIPSSPPHAISSRVFIPYWSSTGVRLEEKYDTYYYFGVRPTAQGTLEDEPGLQNMRLMNSIPEKQKKLVLRMLDSTVTEALFDTEQAQKRLVSQVTSVLDTNSFSGIVLDIEVPFSLNTEKKDRITKFVQVMCTAVHTDYKTCSQLIYGDLYYRNRPFDVKKLGEIVDTILIMAYDFHKAGGEPGPNFPMSRRSINEGGPEVDYGYDFKQMISDFSIDLPKEKTEVVFGMYGYDWTLNEQGTPLKAATAISVNNIQSKVQSSNLKVMSNEAKEKKIEYVDTVGNKHIVWYEDEESAAVKTKYLQQQGVWQISFWAQSYF